jgi:hypothetical protein
MITRLHLFFLLVLFFPVSGQTQVAPLNWNLTFNEAVSPSPLTINWLAQQIKEAPKKKLIGNHEGHEHYEYHWKKSGIRVEVNQPGGLINSIEVSFKKSKRDARTKLSATPIFALSVSGELIDEQTPVSSFLQGKWNPNAGNGKNLIPARYFFIDQGTRINAFLNAGRTSLNQILITFSR